MGKDEARCQAVDESFEEFKTHPYSDRANGAPFLSCGAAAAVVAVSEPQALSTLVAWSRVVSFPFQLTGLCPTDRRAPALAGRACRRRDFSEVEMNLRLDGPVSGLRGDLAEGTGIDVQVGITRGRMVEYVACVQTECEELGLTNPDAFLHIRVEGPDSGSFDVAQTQRAEFSASSIPQYDIAVGIRKRGVRAKSAEVRRDTGACRIRDPLVLLIKEIPENIALI